MLLSKSRKQLDAITKLSVLRGTTGGLTKRIDENRELLELLLNEAPEFVAEHRWLIGWIKANDSFFTQLSEILQVQNHDERAHNTLVPRPWPVQINSGSAVEQPAD
ncbi:hypothetical protein G3O06_23450 [Burkholderia sp. Ac-20345]|uniref:hypothetical protein n=1 Tax=Burkholderia sp. Ac-20345 TaxID=2703891 RepID=UPI00197C14CA|nr:hypothetical protein [Burkholderia sp. Ac-20345]MBN3780473.1 hypothetical protein [Burkholderia sp. Ac-20345]